MKNDNNENTDETLAAGFRYAILNQWRRKHQVSIMWNKMKSILKKLIVSALQEHVDMVEKVQIHNKQILSAHIYYSISEGRIC